MAGNIINTQRLIPGLVEKPGKGASAALTEAAEGPRFTELLSDMIQSVNETQHEAGDLQQAFLAGEPVELHQVMIKAEEAGLSMDLLLEIRGKLINAYNDLIKMPI